MARLSFLLVGALTALSGFANASSAVKDLIPSNFDEVVLKSGKPALVEFFAPWCGHCKTLAPVYEELAQASASVRTRSLSPRSTPMRALSGQALRCPGLPHAEVVRWKERQARGVQGWP